MNTTKFAIIAALFACACSRPGVEQQTGGAMTSSKTYDYAIVIHGGAGTILREQMTPEREAAYKQALNIALDIGEKILKDGGSAMDAVEQTIRSLEDNPLFNAGKGAVFNHAGKNELDASFMDGATRNAGAVGGVTIVKNPITLARAVMERSPHVMLTGRGAEAFAIENGIDTVAPSYFFTQERWDALQRALAAEKREQGGAPAKNSQKMGTVGCVARDKRGNLAAGTSTGGMTNKRWNRLGDSPVVGAGTFADNNTCAVSCTGHGEYFIRYVVAYDIAALMEYKGLSLMDAANTVVMDKLVKAGGEGGLIAVDKYGNVALPFNSEGMYRGYSRPGERLVEIYR